MLCFFLLRFVFFKIDFYDSFWRQHFNLFKPLHTITVRAIQHNNLIYVDAVEKKFMQALIFDPASAHK